jgi:hypothetical protein
MRLGTAVRKKSPGIKRSGAGNPAGLRIEAQGCTAEDFDFDFDSDPDSDPDSDVS